MEANTKHTPVANRLQGKLAAKNLAKLPDFCYTTHPATKEPIRIFKGESGYRAPAYPDVYVDEINGILGVTHEQEEAMVIGSMAGWHVPGADPETWEQNAKYQAKLKAAGKRNAKEMRAAMKASGRA